MNTDYSDNESVLYDGDLSMMSTISDQSKDSDQPVKIRKKPGRKPNPASPALRKAQNRAAQRAFRERKERHMRELEVAIKQIREQRDKLQAENEQLKADQEITRSENWYLKGIVLTLQLVCYQHNLVIPQHGPYINDQALSILAQSIPESIATYISVNANNKLPIPSKLFGYKHTIKQRDRYLSTGSIVITKEGVHSLPELSSQTPQHAPVNTNTNSINNSNNDNRNSILFSNPIALTNHQVNDVTNQQGLHPLEAQEEEAAISNMPPLSPGSIDSDHEEEKKQDNIPRPVMLKEELVTSNLAAIQTLRLRLRLQSACVRMDSIPFAIQPTILQLTIPHDPRIDLIPTPHMRDRMILFRDQFDLDDCFRCLLAHSVFHGGDPAVAGNWQLPPEFFDKYWFLTIDYDLRRTTNHWRKLQGLSEIDFKQQQQRKQEEIKQGLTDNKPQPLLEPVHSNLNHSDLAALLGVDFCKISQQEQLLQQQLLQEQQQHQQAEDTSTSYASSLSSDTSSYHADQMPSSPTSTTIVDDESTSTSTFEPIRLTNGYSLSYQKSNSNRRKSSIQSNTKVQRHHPYQPSSIKLSHPSPTIVISSDDTCHPWDTLLVDNSTNTSTVTAQQDYDIMMETLIDTEQTC